MEGSVIEKRYYTAESLEARVHAFEERYGMDSEAFLAAPDAVAPPDRTVWATLYYKARELRERTYPPITAGLLPAS